jgi:hypothetical protein
MRRTIFIGFVLVLLMCSQAFAQCTWNILSVEQDLDRGSILVVTQYTLNGQVVQVGHTRYNEESGDLAGIKILIQKDIQDHCEALIQRIPANNDFIQQETLKAQKELTQPLIQALQTEVGKSAPVKQSVIIWKGKTITVTDDSKNSVSNIIP